MPAADQAPFRLLADIGNAGDARRNPRRVFSNTPDHFASGKPSAPGYRC